MTITKIVPKVDFVQYKAQEEDTWFYSRPVYGYLRNKDGTISKQKTVMTEEEDKQQRGEYDLNKMRKKT